MASNCPSSRQRVNRRVSYARALTRHARRGIVCSVRWRIVTPASESFILAEDHSLDTNWSNRLRRTRWWTSRHSVWITRRNTTPSSVISVKRWCVTCVCAMRWVNMRGIRCWRRMLHTARSRWESCPLYTPKTLNLHCVNCDAPGVHRAVY